MAPHRRWFENSLRRRLQLWTALGLLLAAQPGFGDLIPVGGPCTLPDAITAANADLPVGGCPAGNGSDTITLSQDVVLTTASETFYGDTGLPVVRSAITLDGAGFRVERDADAPEFRIMAVASNGTLTLNETTVSNGRISPGHNSNGGGLFVHYGEATVSAAVFSGNQASGNGGGIEVYGGTLHLDDSTLADNAAGTTGGGLHGDLGATILVTDSTIESNDGWGVYTLFTTANIARTTITNNAGAGLQSQESIVTLTNSTVSGNTGPSGGVRAVFYGALHVFNSTVVGNVGGGAQLETGYGATLTLANTIVANNMGSACTGSPGDDGGNFADDASCGAGFASIVPGVDIDTTLANNGGPTLTHALPPGSTAIDAAGTCDLPTDQRGVPRDDGSCDSGAFEFHEPLYVQMASMSAVASARGVRIRWSTAAEVDAVGFRVLRQTTDDSREKFLDQVGPFIAANGSELVGVAYEVFDDAPESSRAIGYFIEDVDVFGRVTRHGPIAIERPSRTTPSNGRQRRN